MPILLETHFHKHLKKEGVQVGVDRQWNILHLVRLSRVRLQMEEAMEQKNGFPVQIVIIKQAGQLGILAPGVG